jgi:drug/metabolite transporter (DMT)-like permease
MDSVSSSSSWIFFALLSPLMFTGINFIDKYIVEREVPDTRAMPIYSSIMAFIAGTVLWVITGFPVLPADMVFILMVTGAMTLFGAALYFNAMGMEEASRIIVLIQMQPVFVLVLSILFLNETITPEQFVGFVLILGAAVAISLNREGGGFKLSRAFFLILLCDVIWSSSVVLFKAIVTETSFNDVLAYESWGLAVGGIILYVLFPNIRRAFHHSISNISRRGLGVLFVGETLFLIAKLINFLAVSLGPVALVSVLGSTQVFFGVLLGAVLTTFAPAVFQEDISRRNLTRKAVLALVLFGGILLVN